MRQQLEMLCENENAEEMPVNERRSHVCPMLKSIRVRMGGGVYVPWLCLIIALNALVTDAISIRAPSLAGGAALRRLAALLAA